MKQLYFFAVVLILSFTKCTNTNKDTAKPENKINIAVFEGNGAGVVSVIETIEALRIDTGINAKAISAAGIQNGDLHNFDAIIIPGGSGSKQLNNLGEKNRKIVRQFVEQGGGIIGICAGAYMLSSTIGYPNLGIASSIHIDRAHYNRGRGLVQFDLTETGYEVFPELVNNTLFLQYYDGPVLVQGDSLNKYTEIGTYVTDIHPDGFAPEGITPGRTFFLNQDVGKGKVFLTAGHPESTPGMRWMIPRMARWVTNNDLVAYDEIWVRPEINDSSIIFTKELRKIEKDLWWNLFNEDAQNQIGAIDSLYELRSRPAVRWNIGLLRAKDAKVRLRATDLLFQTEYTAALSDLQEAYQLETDPTVKEAMAQVISSFEKTVSN
jgi:glutamine amidotransferase-like uncharacterized protein